MFESGTRWESQVCDTQVIVVRSSEELADLRCGGVAMVEVGADKDPNAVLDPDFTGNSRIGKRYVHDCGAEVLVTKAGDGVLAVGRDPLELKEAKALPASD